MELIENFVTQEAILIRKNLLTRLGLLGPVELGGNGQLSGCRNGGRSWVAC